MPTDFDMDRTVLMVLLVLVLFIAPSCASDIAYRRPSSVGAPETCTSTCTGTASVELRHYTSQEKDDKTTAGTTGSYLLGYVEFDDQGWFHDLSQRTSLFGEIRNYQQHHPNTQFLIVVYAHGWKHNARGPDDDIMQFSKLLERLDLLEQRLAANPMLQKKARKIVGVYLGWRGSSFPLSYLENMTFWTRKNAGERVGSRSVKQLLIELNELRASLNGWRSSARLAKRNDTQLILIGHSFGGLLMYHALHSELIERALRISGDKREGYHYTTAKSFGDFVLLVNPAFEGAAYEPLFRAAMTRCYSSGQRPVMAIVTSQSDWATKTAFPLGRLYTYLQSAPQIDEGDTVRYTVGHLPRYRTHTLIYESADGAADEKREGLSPTSQAQVQQTLRNLSGRLRDREKTDTLHYDGVTVKVVDKDLPRNFPYLVMSAEKEIINGHNDIWNDRFAQFMVSFITKEIMETSQPSAREEKDTTCPPFWLEPQPQ